MDDAGRGAPRGGDLGRDRRIHTPLRRLHISRGDASARRIVNEAALLARLAPHGFECHRLADYPASAQIRLLAEAEIVVSPHGMGLVHLAFHPGPLKLVELFHPTKISASYALLARAKGFEHVALFRAHVDDMTNGYVIDIDAVMAEIECRD